MRHLQVSSVALYRKFVEIIHAGAKLSDRKASLELWHEAYRALYNLLDKKHQPGAIRPGELLRLMSYGVMYAKKTG